MKTTPTSKFILTLFAATFLFVGVNAQQTTKKWFPGHYVSVRYEDMPVSQASINLVKDNPYIKGYKMHLLWNEVETSKDHYDFTVVQSFIDIAEANGKKVLIHVQDRIFGKNKNPFVPAYMLTPEYEGGWIFIGGNSYGRIWLPQYQERWYKYLSALAQFCDDKTTIAGIMNSESAMVGIDESPGYTVDMHLKCIHLMDSTMAKTLNHTLFFQYVNWGFNPARRDEIMRFQVEECRMGFGGPDVLNSPYPNGVMKKTPFGTYYNKYRGVAPFCVECQSSGYEQNSAQIVFNYAVDEVGVHFMPWSVYNKDDRAFTFNDVLAVINAEKGRINTTPPSNLLATGINDKQKLSGTCSVYPNPSKDYVTVKTDRNLNDSPSLKLFDTMGRLCDVKIMTSNETRYEMTGYPAGIYYLHMSGNAQKPEIIKLIKK